MRIHAAEKFQGTPCKYGHPGLRYRSTGGCVECARLGGIAKRQAKTQTLAAATEEST